MEVRAIQGEWWELAQTPNILSQQPVPGLEDLIVSFPEGASEILHILAHCQQEGK